MKGEHGVCRPNGKRQVLTISQIVWTGLVPHGVCKIIMDIVY